MTGTVLFCLLLKLFSRSKFGRHRERFVDVAAPSVVLTEMEEPPSMSHSRCSNCNECSSGLQRASYSMLAPPTSAGSRRTSSTSIRSHTSLPSNHEGCDPVRRSSSPVETTPSGFYRDNQQGEQETSIMEKSPEDELQSVK
ncbi:uncharacterized protein LOC106473184 [Limulus polyphemus]|uniref:Uncharacterized protein LOC106473184 n=1 Tax=Limulus polyphemus TaxID=6850 RepID=A0ABM1BV81_LIMPO|nr:uncharacterized protein LOC106473184 [Limulus polyphemus]